MYIVGRERKGPKGRRFETVREKIFEKCKNSRFDVRRPLFDIIEYDGAADKVALARLNRL